MNTAELRALTPTHFSIAVYCDDVRCFGDVVIKLDGDKVRIHAQCKTGRHVMPAQVVMAMTTDIEVVECKSVVIKVHNIKGEPLIFVEMDLPTPCVCKALIRMARANTQRSTPYRLS